MDRDLFVQTLGAVFEASPWVAEKVWAERPFRCCDELLEALCREVRLAGREKQLALLRAHPELGTRARLSAASAQEQRGAGLSAAADGALPSLRDLNRRYRDKFGFPFIIAVKGLETDTIVEALRQRLDNDAQAEFQECLRQVYRIARFRFEDLLDAD